jgi:hypothetical protein
MRKLTFTSRRPSAGLVVAVVATVLALGGTASAAKVLITSGSQIKNGSIGKNDLARSVRSQLGKPGARGPQGERGPSEAREAYRDAGPTDAAAAGATVASLSGLTPGAYLVHAQTNMQICSSGAGCASVGDQILGNCKLDVTGDLQRAYHTVRAGLDSEGFDMQLLHTVPEGQTHNAVLTCGTIGSKWGASYTKLIAVRLGSETHTAVVG